MGSHFVRPELITLPVSTGDTLTVKRILNTGEQRAAAARMYAAGPDGRLAVGPDGELRTNPLNVGWSMVLGYLVDWTLTDDQGAIVNIRDQPLEVVEAALRALDFEIYMAIEDAIRTHDLALKRARDAEKKTRAGAPNSDPISRSPSVPASASANSTS